MKGKLIVIEGTDCSGKQTQSELLCERLNKNGIKTFKYAFPAYDTPTGKIVGGPYLGKKYISEGWFEEGATNVDALVASCYYAADRRYNIEIIKKHLDNGENVILDRYVESNMAHQGGKIFEKEKRLEMYKKLDDLEFGILELPRPDKIVFLYMPYEYAKKLRETREEAADQHEMDKNHLVNAETSYLELAQIYNFIKIDCIKNDKIKTIEEINDELYNTLLEMK